MTDYAPFWFWINERHRIYLNKDVSKAPWPWTKDEILQKYRFCNVFRELDTVTKWLRVNWRTPYAKHPNLWFAMCVARQTNKIETFRRLGFPKGNLVDYVKRAEETMEKMDEEGERVYGAAYIITAGGQSGPKRYYTCRKVLMPIAKRPPDFAESKPISLEKMWCQLREYEGFGPFISYEVASDLRWTRYYDGSDHMSWANPGPGAKRGICRLLSGSKDGIDINGEDLLREMRLLLRMSRQKGTIGNHVPALEMRDIEHSLCETDKYLRVKTGEGRPKQKYEAP